MFDDIFTDEIKTAIGVATDATRLTEEAFTAALEDRFGSFVEGTKNTDELKYLARYIAANWPEQYRLNTTVSSVPWLSVFSEIDAEEFASYVVEDLGGETIIGQGYSYKATDATAIAAAQGAQDFIDDISTKLEEQLRENAASAVSQTTNLTPEEASRVVAESKPETLTDKFLQDGTFTEDLTIERQMALEPGVELSDLVQRGLEFETQIDLSDLPGFDLLEATDEWSAADTLSYVTDIDQKSRERLQGHLEQGGYFDQARSMGFISARDGTNDVATQVAWQEFVADAILNGQTNMSTWLRSRISTMRNREMASVQAVYRDPAQISTLVDSVSFDLLGRTLTGNERSSLMGKLMEWQREALLGPTYTEERYDVDLQARAKQYFDDKYLDERMDRSESEFLYMIGAIGNE